MTPSICVTVLVATPKATGQNLASRLLCRPDRLTTGASAGRTSASGPPSPCRSRQVTSTKLEAVPTTLTASSTQARICGPVAEATTAASSTLITTGIARKARLVVSRPRPFLAKTVSSTARPWGPKGDGGVGPPNYTQPSEGEGRRENAALGNAPSKKDRDGQAMVFTTTPSITATASPELGGKRLLTEKEPTAFGEPWPADVGHARRGFHGLARLAQLIKRLVLGHIKQNITIRIT